MPTPSFIDEAAGGIFVGREPSWLVRSGISLIALALFLALMLAAFIRYPDVIHAPITLTTAQPPAELVSRIDGRIEKVLVSDADLVVAGQPLLLLESGVDAQQLRRLEEQLTALHESLLRADLRTDLRTLDARSFDIGGLAELQIDCNQLAAALREYASFHSSRQASAELANVTIQRRRYLELQWRLAQKRESYERKLTMEEKLLDGSRLLADQGLVATAQLVPLESRLLDQKLSLDDLDIQAGNYAIALQEIEHRLDTLRIAREETEQRLRGDVDNRFRELSSAVAAWRRHYLITAPADGQITLTKFWSAHQEVNRGEVVMIVSHSGGQKIGKLTVRHAGAGKIKPGQRVDIRLDSYPALEFGSLEATVSAVALVPSEQGYRVDVELPESFVSTHNRQLAFTPNMVGSARIITSDRLLLERLFDKLLYLINSRGE